MKKLLLLLSFAISSYGQSSGANVVNVLIKKTTTLDSVSGIIISAPLQNIGQTSHQAIVVLTNVVSSGVTPFVGSIEGSSDNVTWFPIGPIMSASYTSLSPTAIIVSGYRAYPFVRVNLAFNYLPQNKLATVSVLYVGNSSPSLVLDDALGSLSNLTTVGGVFVNSASYAGLTAGFPNQKATLYGLTINSPSTGTLFTLACSADGVNIHEVPLVWSPNGVAKDLVWPVNVRPWFQCSNAGDLLYYKFTGTGGFNISYSVRGE